MFLPFSRSSKEWEPYALKLRSLVKENGSVVFDPLDLAPKLGLIVQVPDLSGLDPDELRHMRMKGRDHWSGGVYPVPLPDGNLLCMLNPDHPPRRNRITLMEEICHQFFNHAPTKLIVNASGILIRDFNAAQEKEAYGVGAAVLLPWSLFYHRLDKGLDLEEIAEEFDVTVPLVQYRIKVTGGTKLYQARRRSRASAAGF